MNVIVECQKFEHTENGVDATYSIELNRESLPVLLDKQIKRIQKMDRMNDLLLEHLSSETDLTSDNEQFQAVLLGSQALTLMTKDISLATYVISKMPHHSQMDKLLALGKSYESRLDDLENLLKYQYKSFSEEKGMEDLFKRALSKLLKEVMENENKEAEVTH